MRPLKYKQGFGNCGASSNNSSARGGRLGRDYFKSVSLRFIRQGLFLMLVISFFFSSTSSINWAISPSDIDSTSSESESESEELQTQNERLLRQLLITQTTAYKCPQVDVPFIFLFFLFILVIALVFSASFFSVSFPPLVAILLFSSVLHLLSFFYVTVFLAAMFGSFVGCPSLFFLWNFILTFIFVTNAAKFLGGRFDISSPTFSLGCILFIIVILTDFVFPSVSTICTSSRSCLPSVFSPLGETVYDRNKLGHI